MRPTTNDMAEPPYTISSSCKKACKIGPARKKMSKKNTRTEFSILCSPSSSEKDPPHKATKHFALLDTKRRMPKMAAQCYPRKLPILKKEIDQTRLYQPSPTTSRKRFLTLCSSNSSSEDVPEDIPHGTHRLFVNQEEEELTIH